MAPAPLLLAGAAVQRVDAAPGILVLRARAPGETRYVVLAAGRRQEAVGVLADRPWKGAALPGGSVPAGEKQRLRARIEGARVEAVGPRWIRLRAGEATLAVEAGADGAVGLREVADGEDVPADAALAADEEAWLAAGDRLARDLGERAIQARQQDLGRALARARARVARRVEAVRGDLARIGEADGIAARAALFVAAASRAPRGADHLEVTDWSTGEPRSVTLPLDPARPAREQIDAMFKRARRLKQGAAIAGKRLAEAEAAEARLAAVIARLADAATPDALAALEKEARAAAPRDFRAGASPLRSRWSLPPEVASGAGRGAASHTQTAPSPPYRAFRGASGDRILVGRGAARNDDLTFHVARPHDLWLHARGRPGAHVVVPLDRNRSCPPDLLVDAAHLAAHFSDARGEALVEIEHTPRRHLRKPRGSPPGLVVVGREKVLALRVDPERIARLLATEDA
jgi:predicted ribosome quality control (RQC) complex YloA/Tae2 family protein